MALDLLAVGDVEAASEELMFAVTHVARAILLKEGVFPLSRPELPAQLRDSEPDIARLLEDLISGDPTVSSLMSGQKLLEYYIERIAPSPTLA